MVDLYSHDILAAFARQGCPLCRVVDGSMRLWFESFAREGHNSPAAQRCFLGAGGFCRAHSEVLIATIGEGGLAAIAGLYAALVEEDLERLARVSDDPGARKGHRRRRVRSTPCPACAAEADTVARKTGFFLETLRKSGARERYARSDGLCYQHLELAVEAAVEPDPDAVSFLIGDWRTRLTRTKEQLDVLSRASTAQDSALARVSIGIIRRYVGMSFRDE
jgi:hypothetical protein